MVRKGSFRRILQLVAVLNAAYFGFEFPIARDRLGFPNRRRIDFLEDASVNVLILTALGWSAVRRAQVGIALAASC
jgi:hypothetical protein